MTLSDWPSGIPRLSVGPPSRHRHSTPVLRTAWLAGCRFEWAYHQPLALKVGLEQREIERVVAGPDTAGWSDLDASFLRVVDELFSNARVSQATWDVLKAHFTDAAIVEILAVVGQYQLVAFITNTLGVEPHEGLAELAGR
jgi:4-carboxymuconolactone decarboxylase